MIKNKKFTILIPTKNRASDLKITLEKIEFLLNDEFIHCIICDDGSENGTYDFIESFYPNVEFFRNVKSKGIHYTRNMLLKRVKTPYALCIDDDVHLITQNPLHIIESYFNENLNCAIIGFRIFWSLSDPSSFYSDAKSEKVKSFGAGACIIRMSAIKEIPIFPEWFVFYGEEDFAALQLFKKGWEVHYVPEVLVHHRVDMKARKNEKDYRLRLRRSLRSGWYLYLMFYPWNKIPRRFAYTLWIQTKHKVLKGDRKATLAILQAMGDVMINSSRLIYKSNRLTNKEFKTYSELSNTKLYWSPDDCKDN